jgi:hypothetical protein
MSAADKKHLPGITVNPNMRDYSKDPYFVRKAEKARALIAKYGFPKDAKAANKGK